MPQIIISGKGVKILNSITYPDFHIPEKTITFISGNSGCGKSSLLRVCNGTTEIDSGVVLYKGRDILEHDILQLRRQILLVDQSPFFFEGSIYDNFVEYYTYRELPCPKEEEISFYLDLCKIPIPLDSICDALSGGEKQRVFIALFLSFNPSVLMLDEPTAALDGPTAIELLDNIISFCKSKNITLIVVSHDPSLVKAYAEYVIPLSGE